MKGDISQNHVTLGVKKVNPMTLMCLGVANRVVFESMRGGFGEARRVILDKGSAYKDPRGKGEKG